MNEDQLLRQSLECHTLQRSRMTLRAALQFVTSRTWPVVARYLVTSNIPALSGIADRYRR